MVLLRSLGRLVWLVKDSQVKTMYPVHVKAPADISEVSHSVPGNLGAGNCVVAYDEDDASDVSC